MTYRAFVVLAALGWATAAPAASSMDACAALAAVAQPKQVIADCSAALESDGLSTLDRAQALTSRGVAWRQIGENRKSLRDLRAAKRLDARPVTRRMLAWTWHEMGYDKTAEWIYSRVLRDDPEFQGYLSRCVVRLELDKPEAAAGDCAQAFALDPNTEDSSYFYARALNRMDRPEAALKLSNWGVANFPESRRLWMQKASARALSGDVAGARTDIARIRSKFGAADDLDRFLALIERF